MANARHAATYTRTFREALTNVMDAAAGVRGKAYTEAEAILNEIVNLQRYGSTDTPTRTLRKSCRSRCAAPTRL